MFCGVVSNGIVSGTVIAAALIATGPDVGVFDDNCCAFNCHLDESTVWYRGLLCVNGRYLYLIICCKEEKKIKKISNLNFEFNLTCSQNV